MPTETVYGLAADATNPEACLRVFAAKGRPANNPLIVHCASAQDALDYAAADLPRDVRTSAEQLFHGFSPGPISVVLPSSDAIAESVRAGQPTVALRVPAHQLALQLIREAGRPLAAPSANRSGQPSPTDAMSVRRAFGPEFPVLDGGACEVGIESTVVEVREDRLILHRPGFVSRTDLQQVCGLPVLDPGDQSIRSPGRVHPHYRPSGPCWVVSSSELVKLVPALGALRGGGEGSTQFRGLLIYGLERDFAGLQDQVGSLTLHTETDPGALARNLFRVLVEAGDRPLLLVAPDDARWGEALADRMGRAASGQGAIDLARKLPALRENGNA